MKLKNYSRPGNLHPAEVDRERAFHAQLAIDDILEAEVDNGEAKSWIEKLPALIQTNGIGQALAFYKSRTNVQAARHVYRIVSAWLKVQFNIQGKKDEEDILQWLTEQATPQQYRHAQAEAQAYLRWLKQLGKAQLKKD